MMWSDLKRGDVVLGMLEHEDCHDLLVLHAAAGNITWLNLWNGHVSESSLGLDGLMTGYTVLTMEGT